MIDEESILSHLAYFFSRGLILALLVSIQSNSHFAEANISQISFIEVSSCEGIVLTERTIINMGV